MKKEMICPICGADLGILPLVVKSDTMSCPKCGREIIPLATPWEVK